MTEITARRRAEANPTPANLAAAWLERAADLDFEAGSNPLDAIEDIALSGHLTPLEVIGYTMQYLRGAGIPADKIDPLDVAAQMARDGEKAAREARDAA